MAEQVKDGLVTRLRETWPIDPAFSPLTTAQRELIHEAATRILSDKERMTEAKRLIGAGMGDHPNEAIRQSNINQAWHILDAALSLPSFSGGGVNG